MLIAIAGEATKNIGGGGEGGGKARPLRKKPLQVCCNIWQNIWLFESKNFEDNCFWSKSFFGYFI